MGIMILDRRIKANPSDLIPLLKQALHGVGWDMHKSGKNQEGIISFSIFGRFPKMEIKSLLPDLGWITLTGVQGEAQVKIYDIGLNPQDSDIQKYLDEQPYVVTDMFIDIAAFLIRAVEGETVANDWLTQSKQTLLQDQKANPGTIALPNEIMQIDKVVQNATLQQALILYLFHPEKTLAVIAKEKKYKNQRSLATLIWNVRKELIQQQGEKRANELLPHRKSNSSRRKTH